MTPTEELRLKRLAEMRANIEAARKLRRRKPAAEPHDMAQPMQMQQRRVLHAALKSPSVRDLARLVGFGSVTLRIQDQRVITAVLESGDAMDDIIG